MKLELVVVGVERRDLGLETLASTDLGDELLHLGSLVEGRAVHDLPMIEHTLGEGLASGMRAQLSVEAEGLGDGQVGLDGEHGSSGALLFREDLSTTLVETRVDTTDGVLGALDLDEVDGLLETGGGEQAGSVGSTPHGGDDLSSTTMDSISMQL